MRYFCLFSVHAPSTARLPHGLASLFTANIDYPEARICSIFPKPHLKILRTNLFLDCSFSMNTNSPDSKCCRYCSAHALFPCGPSIIGNRAREVDARSTIKKPDWDYKEFRPSAGCPFLSKFQSIDDKGVSTLGLKLSIRRWKCITRALSGSECSQTL